MFFLLFDNKIKDSKKKIKFNMFRHFIYILLLNFFYFSCSIASENSWFIEDVKKNDNLKKEIEQYAMKMSDELSQTDNSNNILQSKDIIEFDEFNNLSDVEFATSMESPSTDFDIYNNNDENIDLVNNAPDMELRNNQNVKQGKSTEEVSNKWIIERRKNPIPEQKKHLLPSEVYKKQYNDENDHLATAIYDGDYKKWFIEALLEADLPLVSYLIDLFNIDLNESIAWDLKPEEMAEKMDNKELKRLLMIKKTKIHTGEFNDKFYIGKKPSVILFDWNNTLIDTIEGTYVEEMDEKLFDGAIAFLHYLKKQDIKVGLISNENNVILQENVRQKKIDQIFDLIIGSGDTLFFKPDKNLGEYIVNHFGGLEQNPYIWMVGDSDRDLQFAINSDFMPIGFQSEKLFEGHVNFDNYQDFHNWFRKNFENID